MRAVILAVVVLLVRAGVANAEITQWRTEDGGNGHWYEAVDANWGDWNWYQAEAEAASLQYAGLPGHLATFTSGAEWTWFANTFGDQTGHWLGGFQDVADPDYSEPLGGWKWVADDPWSFSAWAPGEPNDLWGGENYLVVWGTPMTWGDYRYDESTRGFVVEYGTDFTVPEPSTWALLACSGLAGLVARRRRKM